MVEIGNPSIFNFGVLYSNVWIVLPILFIITVVGYNHYCVFDTVSMYRLTLHFTVLVGPFLKP